MSNEGKIKGLTPELISDIYDIVEKFGTLNKEDEVINFSSGDLGLDYKIYISTSTIFGNKNLIISKNIVMLSGMEMIDVEGGYIAWDKTLTAEEVTNAINKIDELATKHGLIDCDDKRKRICDKFVDKSNELYRVDEIFKQGTVFNIPRGKDPAKMLELFDHPEKLTIIKESFGTIIRLKDDTDYLEKRKNIVIELLKEKGFDLEDIRNLSLDDIMEMREEIDKRLEKDKK